MDSKPKLPTLDDWLNRERINLRPTIVIDGKEWDMGDALLLGIPGAIKETVKSLRTISRSAND